MARFDLPTIQDIIEGYEERSVARQAARQAEKAEAAPPQTQQAVEAPLPSKPGHGPLYTSSDLSRLDFSGEIPYFGEPKIAQNIMIYYIM